MASQKLAGGGKRRTKLIWTEDMRFALDILAGGRSKIDEEDAAIFCRVFEAHIRQCGFTGPVPTNTLRSQCGGAEKKKSKAWASIASKGRTSEGRAKVRELTARIEEVRASLQRSDSPPMTAGDSQSPVPPEAPDIEDQHPVMSMHSQQVDRLDDSEDDRIRPSANPGATATRRSLIPVLPSTSQLRKTPLSKRAPVAVWNPELVDREMDDDDLPASKRRRTVSRVLQEREDMPGPSTPSARRPAPPRVTSIHPKSPASKSPRTPASSSRKMQPKRPYHRPDDAIRGIAPLNLTEKEHALTEEPMVSVTEELARPSIPALFYRYWTPAPKHSQNSEDGFVAGKFAYKVRMWQPPPPPSEILWHDIYDHIDRNKVPNPFVSVSNALWWIIRLALKEADPSGRISVIDASRLDQRSIFHAAPYHKQTKKTFTYHDGAWHYHGTHEFLIWREIPGDAIVRTFKVGELLRFVKTNAALEKALAFTTISKNGGYKTTMLPALRARGIDLSPNLCEGMASLVGFLGLEPSDMLQMSHAISDVIQGWAIQLTPKSSREWARLATIFEQSLTEGGDGHQLSIHNQETRLGFLDGLRWGCSKHFNTKHELRLVRLMQRQARLVGLDDPAQILSDDLDATKIRLQILGARNNRLIEASQGSAAPRRDASSRRRLTAATAQEDEPGHSSSDSVDMENVIAFDDDGRVL